jgi:hypothetical protein
MDPNTNIDQGCLPFVLKGLGYYLDPSGSQVDETSLAENPRDTSHLATRNYTVEIYPFHCPDISKEASA